MRVVLRVTVMWYTVVVLLLDPMDTLASSPPTLSSTACPISPIRSFRSPVLDRLRLPFLSRLKLLGSPGLELMSGLALGRHACSLLSLALLHYLGNKPISTGRAGGSQQFNIVKYELIPLDAG